MKKLLITILFFVFCSTLFGQEIFLRNYHGFNVVSSNYEYLILDVNEEQVGVVNQEVVDETDNLYRIEGTSTLYDDNYAEFHYYNYGFDSIGEYRIETFNAVTQNRGETVDSTYLVYGEPTENFSALTVDETKEISVPFMEVDELTEETREGVQKEYWTFQGFEQVEVPMGVFDEVARMNVKITLEYDDGEIEEYDDTTWNVKFVGAIKREVHAIDTEIENYPKYYILNSISPTFTYDIWKAKHFTKEELLNSDVADFYQDLNGDDVPNLLRYAVGRTPREQMTNPTDLSINNNRLNLSYERPNILVDVNYIVGVSGDLNNWDSSEEEIEKQINPIDEYKEEVTAINSVTVTNRPRQFMRLLVSLDAKQPFSPEDDIYNRFAEVNELHRVRRFGDYIFYVATHNDGSTWTYRYEDVQLDEKGFIVGTHYEIERNQITPPNE